MAGNRKLYRRKRRSCPICHPHKTGQSKRWKNKDLERLARWQRIRQNWLGSPSSLIE